MVEKLWPKFSSKIQQIIIIIIIVHLFFFFRWDRGWGKRKEVAWLNLDLKFLRCHSYCICFLCIYSLSIAEKYRKVCIPKIAPPPSHTHGTQWELWWKQCNMHLTDGRLNGSNALRNHGKILHDYCSYLERMSRTARSGGCWTWPRRAGGRWCGRWRRHASPSPPHLGVQSEIEIMYNVCHRSLVHTYIV